MRNRPMMLGALCALTLAACGTETDESQANATTAELAAKDLYACKTDSDCVAISKGGCCPEGWKVAVNSKDVSAYDKAHECTKPQICPLYVVDDTRQAECLADATTGKRECTMVAIDQIQCGGFIAPADQHKCPSGYDCKLGKNADLPGSCVQGCVDTVDCTSDHHWSSVQCKCVPDFCADTVLCINGYHWSAADCTCVAN